MSSSGFGRKKCSFISLGDEDTVDTDNEYVSALDTALAVAEALLKSSQCQVILCSFGYNSIEVTSTRGLYGPTVVHVMYTYLHLKEFRTKE